MIYPTGLLTQSFDDAITSGKETHILITFDDNNNTQFDDSNISSDGIQINSYFNSDNNLHYGGIYSREIVINFINSSAFDNFDWTNTFNVALGVEVNGSYKYITLGYFRGEKPKIYANSPIIQFVAHDELYYANKTRVATDFKNSLPNNYTYEDLLYYAGVGMGIQFTSPYNLLDYFTDNQYMYVPSYPFRNGLTYGEIIKEVADANLLNVLCDSTSGVKLKRLSKPLNYRSGNYKVKYLNCYNLQIEETEIWNYNKIIISDVSTETDYVRPSNQPTYTDYYKFVDNKLLWKCSSKSVLCDEMLNKLQSNTVFPAGYYKPMTVEVNGGVCVEPGDVIPVEIDENGTTIDMPIFKTTFYWNGSCRCVYECTGDNDKGLTKGQQDSYELNGIIDDAINNNNNNYVSKEQGQDTFPNLTNASISPYTMLIPQGADLDTYEEPGTYICSSGTDAATMSNVPPGVTANFKLIVNRNTGDGNPNWYGCQIVQTNDLIHIRKHQATSYGTWEQIGYTNVADTWAEFLAKAKARAEITFTFFGNTTVTNKLCGMSQKSYGTCTYTSGYLCWNLTTFDDYSYFGWWKESDDSIKVYPIQVPNGLVTMVYEKTGVTIPNNSTFTVDLSSNVPSGYAIYSAEIHVKYNESEWWSLPYFNDAMDKGMWIRRITNNKITIRCSDSGWGSNNRVQVIAHMRRS